MNLAIEELVQLQDGNILTCDFLWSLFVAAARSYRFSSVLHPFPSSYHNIDGDGEQKNMVALRQDIADVPKLSDIGDPNTSSKLCKSSQDLIQWVLTTQNFHLKLQEKAACLKQIKELTGQIMSTPDPSYVFEVIYSEAKAERFEELRNRRKTFHAYHGSRFDNFYSILHNGLNSHLNKVSAFGEGTYLSSELSLCLMYSQAGEGWKHSQLGTKLSCVAVCEMIDDSSVKCQIKEGTSDEKKSRAQASKMTDSVPEKYYVVQNNDMMRLRYLLVYKSENPQDRPSRTSGSSWIRDHKFPLLMLAYVLLLVAIGIANSRSTINTVMKFYRSLTS